MICKNLDLETDIPENNNLQQPNEVTNDQNLILIKR